MTGQTIRALAVLGLLAACSPQQVTEDVTRAAARSVVVPVLMQQYREPEAEIVSDCILTYAAPSEVQAVARDVGNRAGTLTVQNIRIMAMRPAVASCVTSRGLLPIAPF
jgi:hypothetical protein